MALSLAYVATMEAIGTAIPDRPFPPGLNRVELGEWTLTANASGEELKRDGSSIAIPPYSILAEHKVFCVICILDPGGGMIGGGMTEDEFIEQMNSLATPSPQPGGKA
jgi:hypothetical protein